MLNKRKFETLKLDVKTSFTSHVQVWATKFSNGPLDFSDGGPSGPLTLKP